MSVCGGGGRGPVTASGYDSLPQVKCCHYPPQLFWFIFFLCETSALRRAKYGRGRGLPAVATLHRAKVTVLFVNTLLNSYIFFLNTILWYLKRLGFILTVITKSNTLYLTYCNTRVWGGARRRRVSGPLRIHHSSTTHSSVIFDLFWVIQKPTNKLRQKRFIFHSLLL